MADFPSAVNPPGGMSYAAPLMNFANFSNWAADDPYKKIFDQQQQQLNAQRLQLGQQAIDVGGTFKGGLPIDPTTGQIDYKKAVAMLAQKGDIGALWNGADAMLSQSAMGVSPLLGGGGGGQPAAVPGAAPGAPASVPARPLPPPAANSPRGDTGTGSITDIVTDRLPSQNMTTGQTILKIAQVMGVDPNEVLTPGQLRRAQGLLQKYAPEISGQSGAQPASFSDRFAAAGGDQGGNLPPSANAVSPAPRVMAAPAAAGGPAQPPAGQPVSIQGAAGGAPGGPAAPAQPQPQGGGPIVPQVPLPKGFTDPQQAILALRAEAARLSANPKAAGQVAELNNYAQRIEQSLQPLQVNPNTTLLAPGTGQVLYQGPGAAMMGAAAAGGSPTLDADAERYRLTGTLPPNMGRGMQGAAEAKAIRAHAVEQEIAAGGDPAQWVDRWQDFKAKGIGKSTAERVRANREENLNIILRATEAAIPAAVEASRNLPRSDFVPLNKLIQKGEVMTSNPRLLEFGMANLQLAEHWARAMNPTGVMRESDRDKALSFLSTAYGNNTYEAAARQLQKQVQREKAAVREGGSTVKPGESPVPGADAEASNKGGASTKVSPAGISWSIQ